MINSERQAPALLMAHRLLRLRVRSGGRWYFRATRAGVDAHASAGLSCPKAACRLVASEVFRRDTVHTTLVAGGARRRRQPVTAIRRLSAMYCWPAEVPAQLQRQRTGRRGPARCSAHSSERRRGRATHERHVPENMPALGGARVAQRPPSCQSHLPCPQRLRRPSPGGLPCEPARPPTSRTFRAS
jgi:hypothetical protein